MARYSSNTDIYDEAYRKMGPEWHDRAEAYVDNMHLTPNQLDSADWFDTKGNPVPWELKEIAKYYAMEEYAAAQPHNEAWIDRRERAMRKRMFYENRFDPAIAFTRHTVNPGDNQHPSQTSAKKLRA